MRPIRIPLAALACAGWLLWTAGPAHADPLNDRPQFTSSELSELDDAFDDISKDGDYDIDIVDDQSKGAIWHPVASLVSVAKMVSEIADMPEGASFGVYEYKNESNKLEMFDDSSNPIFGVTLNFGDFDGDGDKVDLWATSLDWTSTVKLNDFGMTFGFYYSWDEQGSTSTWYSEDSLNDDEAHMLIYPSNPDESVNINGQTSFGNKIYAQDAGHHYIAVEQGGIGPRDNPDFTDLVVQLESVTAAPEPSSILLLSLGAAGFAAVRRRRKRS